MKTGIGGKMSDKKSVLEEVMKDMEDGKEIKIPSTSIKDFVERKYGMSDKRYIVPEGMAQAAETESPEFNHGQWFTWNGEKVLVCGKDDVIVRRGMGMVEFVREDELTPLECEDKPEVPAPQERWTKHEVAESIRRNYHYTEAGDGEIFITKILADLDPPSKY